MDLTLALGGTSGGMQSPETMFVCGQRGEVLLRMKTLLQARGSIRAEHSGQIHVVPVLSGVKPMQEMLFASPLADEHKFAAKTGMARATV